MKATHAVVVTRLALMLACLGLIACQPRVFLMPTPAVITEAGADPFALNPSLVHTNEIDVFYATNRFPVGLPESRGYTIIATDDLRLGVAHMRIGPPESDWSDLYKISKSPEHERPEIFLENMEELAVLHPWDDFKTLPPRARAFFDLVNESLDRSLDKDLMVYVHGANNNVFRAGAQAAQYRHFTGRNSVVLAFAWPSAESIFRYGVDVQNAALTAPVFAHLIAALGAHTNARYINLLAYSAGAQVLAPALVELGRPRAGESRAELRRRLRLGEVYFAAPDVDFKAFTQRLPVFADLPRAVTVAINFSDSVLGLAEAHHGVSRLGRPNVEELTEAEGLLLIEASREAQLDTVEVDQETVPALEGGSHSFWYSHPWLSGDVLLQFMFHLPPAERGLETRTSEHGFVFSMFPPDYPSRLSATLQRLRAVYGEPTSQPEQIPSSPAPTAE